MSNYYEILEINIKATNDEIKKAYKRLVKENHPDLCIKPKKTIKELQEAYIVLISDQTRKEYDKELFKEKIYDLVYIADIYSFKKNKKNIYKYKLLMKDAILLKIDSDKYINLSKIYSYDQIIELIKQIDNKNIKELSSILIYDYIDPDVSKNKIAKNIKAYKELLNDKDTIRKLEIIKKN